MTIRICENCKCKYNPIHLPDGGRKPRGYKKCPKCFSKNTREENSNGC